MDFKKLKEIDKELIKRRFRIEYSQDGLSYRLVRNKKTYSPSFSSIKDYSEWVVNDYNNLIKEGY